MEISINSINCRYEQAGSGKDVLLLHGWGGEAASWLPVYHHLREKCRVTALDFPGHGKSGFPPEDGWSVHEYADFTARFIEEVGIAGCDIVAHSFGCRVSILLCAQHPELVGKLLMTGAAGLRKEQSPAIQRRQKLFSFLKKCAHVIPGGDALREKFAGNFGSADYRNLPPSMRATFVKVVNEDLSAYLPRIKAQPLLVFGRQDTETPLWMGEKMEKEIPGSALVVLENAGHFAYLDKLYEFLRILDAYLFVPEG